MYSLYCGFVHLICLFIWFALFKWFLSHSASRLTVQYRIPPYPAMCVLTSLQGLVTLYLKLTSILLFDVVAVNISVLKENCLEMEKFDEGDLKENVGIAEDLMVSTRVFTNILTDFLHDLEVSVPPSPAMYPACIQLSFIPPLVSSQLPCMSGSDDFINVVAVTGLHAWFEEFLFRSKFNE